MILMGFFDEFYKLMLVSQYFITQKRRKSDLCFQNLMINVCFWLLVVINTIELFTYCQNSKSIAKYGVDQLNNLSI